MSIASWGAANEPRSPSIHLPSTRPEKGAHDQEETYMMPGHRSLEMSPDPHAALDPVCGMMVKPATAAAQVVHDGTTYYFCSVSCSQKFAANPAQYLAGQTSVSPMASAVSTAA